MRHRSTRPNQILIGLAVSGVLALAACGSDGGGSSDSDTVAFCDELAVLADSVDDSTAEEDLETLRAIAEAAPSEVADDMNALLAAFEQLAAFDPESASEDELADFEGLIEDLDAASDKVEDFAVENCPDLPADFFDEG